LFHALNFLWGAHVKKAEEGKNAFPNTERELKMKAAAKKWAAGLAAVAGVGAMALGFSAPTPASAQYPLTIRVPGKPAGHQPGHPDAAKHQPGFKAGQPGLRRASGAGGFPGGPGDQ